MNVKNLNIAYNLNQINKKNKYLDDINKKISFGSEKDRFDLKNYQKLIKENKKIGPV